MLYDRLRELTEAGLIGRHDEAYALTTLGRVLGDAIRPLELGPGGGLESWDDAGSACGRSVQKKDRTVQSMHSSSGNAIRTFEP